MPRHAGFPLLLGLMMTWSGGGLLAADPPPPKVPETSKVPDTPKIADTRKIPDTTEQRVGVCAACHGKQGEGIQKNEYYPRLAGKPADYLYNQLQNFRAGRRASAQMAYIVKYLSDDYLKEMAAYYAKLRPPYPPPQTPGTSKEILARGEALVTKDDSSKGLVACASCHGKALTGMQPAIPGLVGLNSQYIVAQLSAWKTGLRKASAPDCMAQTASRLEPADISAVAVWLASQPAPVDALPAPASSQKLPIACGSVPQ